MVRVPTTLAIPWLLALTVAGCDDPFSVEEGHVKVRNYTDRTITVYYDRAYGDDQSQWSKTTIGSGESEILRIDSVFWEAELLVVYCGYAREYDVDLGFLGWDTVNVFIWEFPVCE